MERTVKLPRWGTQIFEVLAYRVGEPQLSRVDVAWHLGVPKPNVDTAIWRLRRLGLIQPDNDYCTLVGMRHYQNTRADWLHESRHTPRAA